MPTTTYTVIDGEIVHENRAGVQRDYVPDPLGSTVALLDGSQNQTDTWGYWPYGEVRTRAGTTATPFQYVGTLGYYRDSASRTYIRARHLKTSEARWLTEDPLWPAGGDQNCYWYASASPATWRDPSGLLKVRNCTSEQEQQIRQAWSFMCSRKDRLDACWQANCCSIGGKSDTCFSDICDDDSKITISCADSKLACAHHACSGWLRGVYYICPDFWSNKTKCGKPLHCQLVHESLHNCGIVGHPPGFKPCGDCAGDVFGSCKKMIW